MIYLVAALEALFYLCSIPVCAAFRVNTDSEQPLRAGVGLFTGASALKRQKMKRRAGGGQALRLLRRLKGLSLTLRGSLDLGDAAATALACGALEALLPALGVKAGRITVEVSPRFDGRGPAVALAGMLRARAGQIILAAAHSGIDDLNGRIAQWTDIRSKAS